MTRARGFALDELVGEGLEQPLVRGELRVVVVADDEADPRLLRRPLDQVGVDEALAILGRLRREGVPRQRGDEIRGELDRVDELPLRGAPGMK